jgi:hypothetical protein
VVVLALVIVLFPAGQKRRSLEMLAAVLAVLMCWSRIYLGVHWLSHVAAGVALGAAVAIEVAVVVAAAEEGRTPGSAGRGPLTAHTGTNGALSATHNDSRMSRSVWFGGQDWVGHTV